MATITTGRTDMWRQTLEAIMDRLAIPQDVRQTTDARIAANSLTRALDSGHAPIVWADAFSLPYNGLQPAERMWGMMPVVVFGCEGDTYYVADRSRGRVVRYERRK